LVMRCCSSELGISTTTRKKEEKKKEKWVGIVVRASLGSLIRRN
jgi:hypothetical protein